MAQQMAIPDNQVVSFADALGKVSPLLFGSGKTTTDESESGTVSPGSQSANDALLAQIMPQITGTAATDPIVANILAKAQEAFAPAIAGQTSSGLYNSTTLQGLRDQAVARATGEASSAVLQHQTQSADIAQRAIAANMQATRGQAGVKTAQTGSILSPQMLASLGTSLFGKSALNYAKDKLGFNNAATGKDLGSGNISSTIDSSNAATQDVGYDSFGNPTSGGGGAGGSGGGAGSAGDAATADSGGTISSDAVTSSLAQSSAPESLDAVVSNSNAVLNTGAAYGETDAGAQGLDPAAFTAEGGDALVDGGVISGLTTADTLGAGASVGADGLIAGTNFAAGDAAAFGGGAVAADVGAGVAEEAGGDALIEGLGEAALAWIICTELVRQKKLPYRFYISTASVFAAYDAISKRGYYLWAVPCVKHLRSNPNSKFSFVLQLLFNARVEHIAAGMKVKSANKNVLGFLATHGLYAGCWVLGRLLKLLSINPTPAEVIARG